MDRGRPVCAGARAPERRAFWHFAAAAGQLAPPEFPHGSFHPAEQVDSVRDVADGDFLDFFPRIKRQPHFAADLPVQFADAVGRAGKFQREDRHAKSFLRVLRMHAAKPEDVRKRHGQLRAITLHRKIHQVGRETVVSGLDGRVRGEMAARLGLGQRVGVIFPADIFSRINSSVRNAAWPSFM